MSKIDSNSLAEKRISCKMVQTTSSFDWQFHLSDTNWDFNSDVFSDGKSGIEWKMSYYNMTTEVEDSNFCIHDIFLDLVSRPAPNILVDVQLSFRPGNTTTMKTISSNVAFTDGRESFHIARFKVYDIVLCRRCDNRVCKCEDMPYLCKVTVWANYPALEEILESDKLKESVLANLVPLCSSSDFDLKIVVNSAEIPVHRTILAARSEFFLRMFQHRMQESKSNMINIVDLDEETVRHLVDFLYTSSLTTHDTELLSKLIMASDKYYIHDLRDICESMLILKMDTSNVVDILKKTVLVDSLSKLRKVAIALIGTDPYHYSTELKETLVPINSLFHLMKNSHTYKEVDI